MSTYSVEIAGVRRELPVVPVGAGTRIAFLKLYGDLELVDAAISALHTRLDSRAEVILGPETGGILLALLLARSSGVPYVAARKKTRPDMRAPIRARVNSIGTPGGQQLFLGEDDAASLHDRRVALIDEVVSSGGTVDALRELVDTAGGRVVQVLAVATEGERRADVTSLCHLPLFPATAE